MMMQRRRQRVMQQSPITCEMAFCLAHAASFMRKRLRFVVQEAWGQREQC